VIESHRMKKCKGRAMLHAQQPLLQIKPKMLPCED
jgi:hypothetical protein